MSDNSSDTDSSEPWLRDFYKKNVFTTVLINARSLRKKLDSLKATLRELSADVCLLTETWFAGENGKGRQINVELDDFRHRTGYAFLRKDRVGSKRGGGIAVCYDSDRIEMCKAKIPPSKHEVFAAVGRRKGQRRKVVVIVIYVPPWYNAQQNKSLYSYTNDVVLAIRKKYDDPSIIIGGDFNRRSIKNIASDFTDIKQIKTGPTRGAATLDVFLTNLVEDVTDQGTVDPIESEEGIASDHRTVFFSVRMPRVPDYVVQKYSYHHITDEGCVKFKKWLTEQDWPGLLTGDDSSIMVERLHESFKSAMDMSFEYKTRNKKSSEPAWMADWIREIITDRRKVFGTDGGRSQRWKTIKKKTSRIVKKRKKTHNEGILKRFNEETNPGKFFNHIRSLLDTNGRPRWSPHAMFPLLSEAEAAEECAAFFNNISSEYRPLNIENIPKTFERDLPRLTNEQVLKRIKSAKKPNSTVPGDIAPVLFKKFPELLSQPATIIFNAVTRTGKWPTPWKREYVTIIPKTPYPTEVKECRNISCTNFLSKVYESFVLEWGREEVRPKLNQYGGEKGASATHLLVEVMSDVTSALEDNRAGMVLSAIDFSKAFNRLDHEKCLESFAKKGASNQVLGLLSSFLSGRLMAVRMGETLSQYKPVNAGAPQGSVLGCYLFNVGVDDLEENFEQADSGTQEEAHLETHGRSDDYPATSTPSRVGYQQDETMSPICGARGTDFRILPGVANVPHWVPKPKDPLFNYGVLKSYKYVDDNVNTSAVNMRKAKLLVEEGNFFKQVIDTRTQNLLQHVSENAARKGMSINAEKTNLMCVSAATSFKSRVQVTLNGQTIVGQDKMRILGVTLDYDCTFKSHVEDVKNRLRSRTWALSRLRKIGLDEEKLVKAYKTLIRPVAEFAAPAWHSMISADRSEQLERQQTLALKHIYGTGLSAAKMRAKADIVTLSKRRENAVLKFAKKCITNPRCQEWFIERTKPSYARRLNQKYPRYKEKTARTDRFRNSPKIYMTRLLNNDD